MPRQLVKYYFSVCLWERFQKNLAFLKTNFFKNLFFAALGPFWWTWAFSTCSSVVMAQGLSCSVACGTFPDQGSNLCPLYWQADSLPLDHQGGLRLTFPSVEPVKEMALTYMGGHHPVHWGLESNRKAEEGWICSFLELGCLSSSPVFK